LGEVVAAGFLGILQGLTEFLPVSSSAHLILVPWVFGWTPEGIAFDVALHVGTAAAVLAYFWKEWLLLITEAIRGIFAGDPFGNEHRRLAWYLVAGTVPAVIAGLAFEHAVEQVLRSPLVTVVTLTFFGLLLYAAEKRGKQTRSIGDFTLSDSIWVGLSQAVALVPGVSRSGITITTALFRGADRASAARFSFLLGVPAILAAAAHEGLPLLMSGMSAEQARLFLIGMGVSGVVGYVTIKYFLKYLVSHTLAPFAWYRIALAAVTAVWLLSGRG